MLKLSQKNKSELSIWAHGYHVWWIRTLEQTVQMSISALAIGFFISYLFFSPVIISNGCVGFPRVQNNHASFLSVLPLSLTLISLKRQQKSASDKSRDSIDEDGNTEQQTNHPSDNMHIWHKTGECGLGFTACFWKFGSSTGVCFIPTYSFKNKLC